MGEQGGIMKHRAFYACGSAAATGGRGIDIDGIDGLPNRTTRGLHAGVLCAAGSEQCE
jgi:hypothetical protein